MGIVAFKWRRCTVVRYLCFVVGAAMLFCFSCSKAETEKLRQSLEQKDAEIERLGAEAAKNELLFRQASHKLKEASKKAETAGSELEKAQTELTELREKAAASESLLAQAKDELTRSLEDGKRELQKTEKELESLSKDCDRLSKSLQSIKEQLKDKGSWRKQLSANNQEELEFYGIAKEKTQDEALGYLFGSMREKDTLIQDLRMEREFLHEKFNELMALRQKHESAFDKMKKDGIDTDKYLKPDK